MDLCRFFAADLDPAELPALEAALATTGRVIGGGGLRVRPERVRACESGPHSERIFGPLQADSCMCRRLRGAEHRGAICPGCGVEVGDPAIRAIRWGHVACRVGVVHPTLRARGLEVRVHHVPVSPPATRLGPPLPRGLLPTPTAEDFAVAHLATACRRLDRIDEIEASGEELDPDLRAPAVAAADAALAALFAARAGSDEPGRFLGPTEDAAPLLTGRPPVPGARERTEPFVNGVAFWGEHLLCTGRAGVRVVSLETGRIRRLPAGPCRVIGVVGDVAVFDGQDMWPVYKNGALDEASFGRVRARGYSALDLRTRRWLRALPGAPRLDFVKDQPEDGEVVELDTGRGADLYVQSDRPAFGCYTPALDAMLVLGDDDGQLLDGQTSLPLLDIGAFDHDHAVLPRSGRRVRLGWDYRRGGPPAIVHLGGRRWRVLLPGGAVGEIDEGGAVTRWALPGLYSAAAFSPDGALLAVGEGRRVRVLDAANGDLIRTIEG